MAVLCVCCYLTTQELYACIFEYWQTEDLVGKERKSIVQQAIGGANMARQVEQIKRNRPLVVVGTPGRVADLSRQGILKVKPPFPPHTYIP